jgi:hypothetical protein
MMLRCKNVILTDQRFGHPAILPGDPQNLADNGGHVAY